MIFFALAAHGADLPRTGQTECYAHVDSGAGLDGEPIPCAGTGQDGELQPGAAWPVPRFELTHCDASGPCASQAADCDANESTDVITDHLTGLMWARDQSLSSTVAWTAGLQWTDGLSLCGFSDWHAPSVTQARTLVHFGVDDGEEWLRTEGFAHIRTTWTSTTSLAEADRAFAVAPGWGWTDPSRKGDDFMNHTWAVRVERQGCTVPLFTGQTTCTDDAGVVIACAGTGQDGDLRSGEPWPSPRFTDNGDGSVTDAATSLTWMQDADCVGEVDWQGALDAVAAMNAGSPCGKGFSDWRVPTPAELQSLMSYEQVDPAVDAGHPFVNAPNQPSYTYWTSTSFAFPIDLPNRREAWTVHLYDGSVYNDDKDDTHGHVWPVRGGILDGGDCNETPTPTGETGETGDTGLVVADGPRIWSDPTEVDFGLVSMTDTQGATLIVSNVGDSLLELGSLDPTSNGLDKPFAIDDEGCSNLELDPGETCTVWLIFGPDREGVFHDELEIPSNDPNQAVYRVRLQGTAVRPSTGCGGGTCDTGAAPSGAALAGLLALVATARRRRRGGSRR